MNQLSRLTGRLGRAVRRASSALRRQPPTIAEPRPVPPPPQLPIDSVPSTPLPEPETTTSSGMPIVAASDPRLLPPEPIDHVDWAPRPRAQHPSRPADQGWFLRLDDGREIEVASLVLLGRNPEPHPQETDAELLALGDEVQAVSKTHLAVGVDDAGAYLVDRGSTNGTALVSTSGRLEPLMPGVRSRVLPGQRVSLGERWLEIGRR